MGDNNVIIRWGQIAITGRQL